MDNCPPGRWPVVKKVGYLSQNERQADGELTIPIDAMRL
jgi:hypothetical protein